MEKKENKKSPDFSSHGCSTFEEPSDEPREEGRDLTNPDDKTITPSDGDETVLPAFKITEAESPEVSASITINQPVTPIAKSTPLGESQASSPTADKMDSSMNEFLPFLDQEQDEDEDKDEDQIDVQVPVLDRKEARKTVRRKLNLDSDDSSHSDASESKSSGTSCPSESDSSGLRRSKRLASRRTPTSDSSESVKSQPSSSSSNRKKKAPTTSETSDDSSLSVPVTKRPRGRSPSPRLIPIDDPVFGLGPPVTDHAEKRAEIQEFMGTRNLKFLDTQVELSGYEKPIIIKIVSDVPDLQLRIPYRKTVRLMDGGECLCLACPGQKPKPDGTIRDHVMVHHGAKFACPSENCNYTIGTIGTMEKHLAKHDIQKTGLFYAVNV